MCGNSVHGNREIPQLSRQDGSRDGVGKEEDRKPNMDGCGKSDGPIVPVKSPNKGGGAPTAEAMEGRGPTKGNTAQAAAGCTQRQVSALTGLDRVRQVARREKRARFSALLHHVTVDLLRESFYGLRREASPGVDGVTWEQYDASLGGNSPTLHQRVHDGTYRAEPSKRVCIAKPDGGRRPLGVAALEDKVVQRAVATVLEQIYEADFLLILA
ncbi:MAG: hypothetical protein AB1646_24610 [Thermodesulfobacteriota bacterium]